MLVMYSMNSFLAYTVAERYYKGRHYFWCSPMFDAGAVGSLGGTLPPSSCPAELYASMRAVVARVDRHSPLIAQNRSGILNGAAVKLAKGVITSSEHDEIVEIVRVSEIADYRPLLFVAPYDQIKKNCTRVPISARASPLALEYVAEDVERRLFDVLELP